jgi:hypothetical protein
VLVALASALLVSACSDDAADPDNTSGDTGITDSGGSGDTGLDPDTGSPDTDSGTDPDAGTDAGTDADTVDPPDTDAGTDPDTDTGSDATDVIDVDASDATDGSSEPPVDLTDDDLDPLAGAWSDEFGLTGVQGDIGTAVYASIVDADGTLFIGGDFQSVSGVDSVNVASFDGITWSSDASGPGIVVQAFATDGVDIYAAGSGASGGFGPPGPNFVKRWDGDDWLTVGAQLPDFSTVHDIIIDDDDIFIVGTFMAEDGGFPATGLAELVDDEWVNVDPGLSTSSLRTLMLTPDGFCVGGFMSEIGDLPVSNVACREEGTWDDMGGGLNSEVYELHNLPDGRLMAIGTFSLSEGESTSIGVAIFDADADEWQPLSIGGVDAAGVVRIRTALVIDDSVYFGGSFGVAGRGEGLVTSSNVVEWDGTRFNSMDGGVINTTGITIEPGVFTLVEADNGDIVAGGDFTIGASGVGLGNLGAFDGDEWKSLDVREKASNGLLGTVRAFASIGDGDVVVGGDFVGTTGVGLDNIALYDGTSFSALGGGLPGGVASLLVDDDGTIWAGGGFTDAGITGADYLAFLSDADEWEALPVQLDGNVSALATCPDGSLIATGAFVEDTDGTALNYIARWNGAAWTALGGGLEGEEFSTFGRAVVCGPDGTIYVGGSFDAAGGVDAENFAVWSDGAWASVGAFDSTVNSLDWYEGVLYIAGRFTNIDDTEYLGVAGWDGTSFSAIGAGLETQFDFSPADVSCVFAKENGVFAAGYFERSNGAELGFVAWFDGTDWLPLEEGVNDIAESCHVDSARFFVGGAFSSADSIPSLGLAMWDYSEGSGE